MQKFAQNANDAGRHLAAASSVVISHVRATLLFQDGRMRNLNLPVQTKIASFRARLAIINRLIGCDVAIPKEFRL